MKLLQGGAGIPRMMFYQPERQYLFLGMELLGPSLEDLFNYCQRRFTLKTILMLCDQMIGRVEYMHTKNFIHRDVKPKNILLNTKGEVKLCDFGEARILKGYF